MRSRRALRIRAPSAYRPVFAPQVSGTMLVGAAFLAFTCVTVVSRMVDAIRVVLALVARIPAAVGVVPIAVIVGDAVY